jgi:hypothetical protein
MLAIARRMADRYEGEAGLAYIERSRGWPRCLVRIEPERVRSWGAPDWHPRYLPSPGRPSLGPGEVLPPDTGEPA